MLDVLLKAEQSPDGPTWVDERIAVPSEISQPNVSRIRRQYVEAGLEAALNRRGSGNTARAGIRRCHRLPGLPLNSA